MVSALQKINREGYLRCFIAPPNFLGSGLGMYIVKETLETSRNNYFEIERQRNKIIQFPNQNKN
jgi:hypothetical protein